LTCRREAPDVEQFAREHADQVRVIGLGTKDDADYAVDFVKSTGTYSFPMYWDETKSAWVPFGIVNQPAVVLLSPTGDVIEKWNGTFQADEALSKLT
jgi:hypothetical protein